MVFEPPTEVYSTQHQYRYVSVEKIAIFHSKTTTRQL